MLRQFSFQQPQQARRWFNRVDVPRALAQTFKRGAPAPRPGVQHQLASEVRRKLAKDARMDVFALGQFLVEFGHLPVGQFPEQYIEQALLGCDNLLWLRVAVQGGCKRCLLMPGQRAPNMLNQGSGSAAQAASQLLQGQAIAALRQDVLHRLIVQSQQITHLEGVFKRWLLLRCVLFPYCAFQCCNGFWPGLWVKVA